MTRYSENKYFYKYRSLRGAENRKRIQQTIVDRVVWFAKPSSFNDPFEFLPAISQEAPEVAGPKIRKTAYDVFRNQYSNRDIEIFVDNRLSMPVSQHINLFKEICDEKMSVYSLGERADSCQQWAYYAESHTGICIKFKIDVSEPWPSWPDNEYWGAREVVYHRSRPGLDFSEFHSLDGDYAARFLEDLVVAKAVNWSHEQEVRIVLQKPAQLVKFPPCAIEGIIFGVGTSQDDKDFILNLVDESDIQPDFYEISVSDVDYELLVNPL